MTCDYWECARFSECKTHFSELIYPPCCACVQFDECCSCANYLECCDLVRKYLPQMFRRMVREIRHGEPLEPVKQYIRRNTPKSGKRD